MLPLEKLKRYVSELAGQPPFIHHEWFVEHHLSIIEQLVEELCDRYPQANRVVVQAMVWLHDLGKIITNKGPQEDQVTQREGRRLMEEFGFSAAEIEATMQGLHEMENLATVAGASIEAKIISSADAAAHFIGPFFSLYWYEYHHKSIGQLIEDNLHKITKDYEHKAVLPEVKAFIKPRYEVLREYAAAQRPERYLG